MNGTIGPYAAQQKAQINRMRKIIHIDMDCFYAAIEMRDNPSHRNQPIAVGGSPDKRGVLCTCNYTARQFGIRSAMASAYAVKLCPDLLILPVDMPKYQHESQRIHEIIRQYTDIVEPVSLDEAYLDVSRASIFQGSATRIAQALKKQIAEQSQLIASAGVAPNKFLAKIASDWHKPNGLFAITPKQIEAFMLDLPVEKISGVGKVTHQKLLQHGITTCADLQSCSVQHLINLFGRFGGYLYQICRGIDNRPVETQYQRKSLSVEQTFSIDLPNLNACISQLPTLFSQLEQRMSRLKNTPSMKIRSLFIKIKFSDFTLTTVQTTAKRLSFPMYHALLCKRYKDDAKPVRLLGLGIHFRNAPGPEANYQQLEFNFD